MEEIYQKALEKYLHGSHCKFKNGVSDVSNDKLHAEIKIVNSWKSALGQLLYYNYASPKDELHMYLFGKKPNNLDLKELATFLKSYNVTLFYMELKNETINCTNVIDNNIIYIEPCTSCVKPTTLPDTFSQLCMKLCNKDNCHSNTEFTIDAMDVAKLLNIQKFIIMKTLRESYTENQDYTITKQPSKRGHIGSNNYKKVMLTYNCFKRFCMLSRSNLSDHVRNYFNQLDMAIGKAAAHPNDEISAENI